MGGTRVGKQANRGEVNKTGITQLSLVAAEWPMVVAIILSSLPLVINAIAAPNYGKLT